MKDAKKIFLSIIVLLSAAGTHAYGQNVISKAQQITGDRFSVRTSTPKGATVIAVTRPSRQMMEAIDTGLTELFAVARKNGYSRNLRYSDYTIFIGKADRQADSAGKYSPDIAVGAAQYAGTVYDKGGYIYAAGMVLSYRPSAFVIADHQRDYGRVSDVVRFEGEHIILYFNDRARYEQTKDHSKGGGHPILQ